MIKPNRTLTQLFLPLSLKLGMDGESQSSLSFSCFSTSSLPKKVSIPVLCNQNSTYRCSWHTNALGAPTQSSNTYLACLS